MVWGECTTCCTLATYTLLCWLHVYCHKLDALYCDGILFCGYMYQHNNLYMATPAAISMHPSICIWLLIPCIWLLVLCKSKAMQPAGYYHVYGNNRGVAPAVLPTFIPLLGEAMQIVLPLICVNLVIRCYTDGDG